MLQRTRCGIGARAAGVAALSALALLLCATPSPTGAGEATPKCTKPPAQLVAWWPFDESTGPTAAEIVQGIAGTYMGSPTPISPGKVSGALQFGGSGDHVVAPDDPDLNFGTGDFSIDVWIRTSALGFQYIVNKVVCGIADAPFGYSLFLENGYLGFGMNSDTALLPFTAMGRTCAQGSPPSCVFVADGEWHLVAVTVKRGGGATGGKLWVDNVVNATFDPATMVGTADNNAAFLIGTRQQCRGPAPTEFFEGDMDELEVYLRELKPEDLTKIHEADSAGKCKPDQLVLDKGNATNVGQTNASEVKISGRFFPPSGFNLAACTAATLVSVLKEAAPGGAQELVPGIPVNVKKTSPPSATSAKFDDTFVKVGLSELKIAQSTSDPAQFNFTLTLSRITDKITLPKLCQGDPPTTDITTAIGLFASPTMASCAVVLTSGPLPWQCLPQNKPVTPSRLTYP